MNAKKWKELKQRGSKHYKTLSTEPIDLIAALGMLPGFAGGNMIKYAARYGITKESNDLDKAIHYAELLKAYME